MIPLESDVDAPSPSQLVPDKGEVDHIEVDAEARAILIAQSLLNRARTVTNERVDGREYRRSTLHHLASIFKETKHILEKLRYDECVAVIDDALAAVQSSLRDADTNGAKSKTVELPPMTQETITAAVGVTPATKVNTDIASEADDVEWCDHPESSVEDTFLGLDDETRAEVWEMRCRICSTRVGTKRYE